MTMRGTENTNVASLPKRSTASAALVYFRAAGDSALAASWYAGFGTAYAALPLIGYDSLDRVYGRWARLAFLRGYGAGYAARYTEAA